ncbi:intracellular protease, PfpI family (plasmid) [Gemmatirosa kalamazoonensis]|uniref:Intracellular protease, PfpI family n=1 Tax=Gemmatirosa kalamazoonensis TaxID=861299 RepID=W0RSN7_9BACT|nr:DJ-1/PfpI family protein [Gemmatirosa kalamazoonensis]AHG93320.1 intracellular protease, PfpI family [Gemmatirosa kalamazoonensis]
MARRILIITGDGGECYETLYAVHRLREAGHEPRIAAPTRKRLHLVIHDFEPGWDTYVERAGYRLESDLAFDDVRVDDYDAVLVLGGRAPEYLRHDARVLAIVRSFHERGKWVFGICHGVQVLVRAGLAAGARVTAYEHCRTDVELGGGEYVADRQAVRHGRMVTAQTWQSHPEFYREVMSCLGEGEPGAVPDLASTFAAPRAASAAAS